MGRYIIRLDDIAPNMNWENYYKIKSILDKYNIKPFIGVIHDNQDPLLKTYPYEDDFWEEVRKKLELHRK